MISINDFFIFEASQYAPKQLAKISKCFEKLKKHVRDKEATAELVKLIKEFTKVKDVKFEVVNMYNAMTLPVYDKEMFDGVVDFLKISLTSKLDFINYKKLQTLKSVTEPSDGIKSIYLWFGTPLMKDLTANELTAVLLHELGHCYYMYSLLPRYIEFFLKKIGYIISMLGLNTIITATSLGLFKVLIGHTLFLLFMINLLFIHGIGFRERIEEYRSDNFALKYGYGDDLARTFVKFAKMGEKMLPTESLPFLLKWIKKIVMAVVFILFSSTHPSNKNRIESLEDQIFTEYKKMYPKYKSVADDIENICKNELRKKG